MPCLKCNADFNFFNWKLKCFECEEYYCSKCLKKQDGFLFCETCIILNKRPPNRAQLMELKSKDLQQYLNKNSISTHGLVEKQELVELFCRYSIPVRHRKFPHKLSSNLGGSVPNLSARSQSYLNNLRSNAEAAFYTHARNVWPPQNIGSATSPTPRRNVPTRPPPPPPPPPNNYNTQQRHSMNSNMTNIADAETSSIPTPMAPPPDYFDSVVRKYPKLTDFETEEELSDLSVKQLKEILSLNRVDYKGCVEKGELLERVTRLWSDSKQHRHDNFESNIEECCKICMDAPLDCVLLECGHIATCIDCGKQLAECPICRQYVTRVVRTFKA